MITFGYLSIARNSKRLNILYLEIYYCNELYSVLWRVCTVRLANALKEDKLWLCSAEKAVLQLLWDSSIWLVCTFRSNKELRARINHINAFHVVWLVGFSFRLRYVSVIERSYKILFDIMHKYIIIAYICDIKYYL